MNHIKRFVVLGLSALSLGLSGMDLVPSAATVFWGLGGALFSTAYSREVANVKSDIFSRSSCLSYASTALEGGKYIMNTHTKGRCYQTNDPFYYKVLTKRLEFARFISSCTAIKNSLEQKNDAFSDFRAMVLRHLTRFQTFITLSGNFIDRFDSTIKNNADVTAHITQHSTELFTNLLQIEEHVKEFKTIVEQLNSLGTHDENAQVIEEIYEKLTSVHQFKDQSKQLMAQINDSAAMHGNTQAPTTSGHDVKYENGWSFVHAGVDVAANVGSALLFPKMVALAGSIKALYNAGSFLSRIAAKPGIVGLSTLFGLNCATTFGTLATAYALKKLVIEPVLKPLFIRMACTVCRRPYNPQPNPQPAPAQ